LALLARQDSEFPTFQGWAVVMVIVDTGLEEYYFVAASYRSPWLGHEKPMYLQAAALEPTSIWPRFTLHEVKMRFVTLLLSPPSSSQLLPFTYDRPSLWWRSFGHILASLPIPVAIKKVEKHQFGCYATIQPWVGTIGVGLGRERGWHLIEESLWQRGCALLSNPKLFFAGARRVDRAEE
jgi:hypothetical protein